jgi:hypothetical protein
MRDFITTIKKSQIFIISFKEKIFDFSRIFCYNKLRQKKMRQINEGGISNDLLL